MLRTTHFVGRFFYAHSPSSAIRSVMNDYTHSRRYHARRLNRRFNELKIIDHYEIQINVQI